MVDYLDPILVGGIDALDKYHTNIFVEVYPDAAYEIYTNIPEPNIDELDITVFTDSDHMHEKYLPDQ